MRLFNRKPKVTYEAFNELQRELREVRHLVFPSESQGWITIGWDNGRKADPTKFEQIDEKLRLLAKEQGLEFTNVRDNYSLQKPSKGKDAAPKAGEVIRLK